MMLKDALHLQQLGHKQWHVLTNSHTSATQ